MTIPAAPLQSNLKWENEWQRAQDRVLLYVRLLGVPGFVALEITLEALRRARAEAAESRSEPPASAAMRSLRKILEEKRDATKAGSGSGGCVASLGVWPSLPERIGIPEDARAMPLLNRGTMTPERW